MTTDKYDFPSWKDIKEDDTSSLKAFGAMILVLYLFFEMAWALWSAAQPKPIAYRAHTMEGLYDLIFCFALMTLSGLFSYGLIRRIPQERISIAALRLVSGVYIFNLVMTAGLTWVQVSYVHPGLGEGTEFRGVMMVVFLIATLVTVFTLVYSLLHLAAESERKTRRLAKMEQQNLETQLELLQAYINPHFIFNSLNTLGSLTEENPRQASEFVEKLSMVLRYMLQHRHTLSVGLPEELDNLDRYMYLMNTRFGDEILLHTDDAVKGLDFRIGPSPTSTSTPGVSSCIRSKVGNTSFPNVSTSSRRSSTRHASSAPTGSTSYILTPLRRRSISGTASSMSTFAPNSGSPTGFS